LKETKDERKEEEKIKGQKKTIQNKKKKM